MARRLKDKKIKIYRYTHEGRDKDGYVTSAGYTPIHAGSLWSYIRQTSGKEYYAAMAQQVTEEILFVVNWREDLTMDQVRWLYVEYNGRWYDVQRIDTYEGYKREIQIFAKSMPQRPPTSAIKPYSC